MSSPCKTLQQALSPFRKFIKASGMITNTSVTTIDRKTVTIFGEPGMTMITRSPGGSEPVFDIRHESVVTLHDLEIVGTMDGNVIEIRDAPGPMVSLERVVVRGGVKDNGIQMMAGGLKLTDSQVRNCLVAGINITGGALNISRSQIADNAQDGVKAAVGTQVNISRSFITGNRGTAGVFATDTSMVAIDSSVIAGNTGISGGVSIRGPLVIRNSIISANGLPATSTIGGATLESSSAIFEFNTVADNSGSQGGLRCIGLIDVKNSIVTNSAVQVCNVSHSLTATAGTPVGTGNETGDPAFQSSSLSSPMFYRIGSTSKARDLADQNATLDVDIDGQPRMGRRDMGADEYNGP